jgi:hypothetical protein
MLNAGFCRKEPMGRFILLIMAAFTAAPATAQLGLPEVNLPSVGGAMQGIDDTVERIGDGVEQLSDNLSHIREDRIARLLRRNRDVIERDMNGSPARSGELLLMDAGPADLERIRGAGCAVLDTEEIKGLGLKVIRLSLPAGMSVAKGQKRLQTLLPDATISADNLHFPAGGSVGSASSAAPPPSVPRIATPVGVIDGAAGPSVRTSTIRGFAKGAPTPDDHGSAMVSLLAYAGVTDIRVADVYGSDPAGGNVLAIARALGWLSANGAKVITISLVGPHNAVLQRAVAAVRRQGALIVAPVGNDGPAAPAAYPASYPGVIAVTGVDARNRALIEAGKALHLDYAAPAADMRARDAKGRMTRVRGTSYAAPLVAARAAAAMAHGGAVVPRLDAEAIDLGRKGPDATFGRGLLCGQCRP